MNCTQMNYALKVHRVSFLNNIINSYLILQGDAVHLQVCCKLQREIISLRKGFANHNCLIILTGWCPWKSIIMTIIMHGGKYASPNWDKTVEENASSDTQSHDWTFSSKSRCLNILAFWSSGCQIP